MEYEVTNRAEEDDLEDQDNVSSEDDQPNKKIITEKTGLKKFRSYQDNPKRGSIFHQEKENETIQQNEISNSKNETRRIRFINKQRILLLCSRGTTARFRYLLKDLKQLLPHSKKDVKMDGKDALSIINEICELRNCNNCLFLEVKKKMDCYMWIAKAPNGPSVRFHVTNVHTIGELKFLGNCLLGSRPVLLFDKQFDERPHWRVIKELLSQGFGTPRGHPNSKPFIDHLVGFYILDNKIWFRNYQMAETEEGNKSASQLVEIGPRFVLDPTKIFAGSFAGRTIFQSDTFISPNAVRAGQVKGQDKYVNRVAKKAAKAEEARRLVLPSDPLDSVFDDDD